jgi:uncharacterized iron-regulated membrane protein
MNTRSLFRNLHLFFGLVVGLVASAVGISGSILTFREMIEHALYRPKVSWHLGTVLDLQPSYEKALAVSDAEKRRIAVIVLPDHPGTPVEFVTSLRGARSLKEADQTSVYANHVTNEIISQRRRNASFIAWLRDLHFALFAGTTGLKVNGWFALGLIFISLTGLVLWLQTYEKGKAFAVNLKASWKRQLWDWHRLFGIVMLLF